MILHTGGDSMKVIKDSDCNKDSPVIYGHRETPVYGTGQAIKPKYPGKNESDYDKKIYLPELLPLEEYDLVIILFSGGKDSLASYFKLLELGVPKEKIELWHHDIDGGHPTRKMDWPITQAYIRAFADAKNVKLRLSWRVNGFFGELYRVGASLPIEYEDNGETMKCRITKFQSESEQISNGTSQITMFDNQDQMKQYGYRLKFPAKSGDLSRRWCSSYLKISVADSVIFNLEQTRSDIKILIVSGERRGESVGRSKYNEMEIHRKNAVAKAHRIVHQWRVVIDYSLRDVWEVLKRHKVTPHPCYTCGWGRCSCMCCIFSLPCHWAGIRELFPDIYEAFRQDEIRLNFTLDNKKTLDEYVSDAESCVYRGDPKALNQLVTGQFSQTDIYQDGEWKFPAGAFKGTAGGPC